MTTIVRIVGKRDSATSILRKLGLKPNAYGLFMKQLEDGRWEVDLPKVYEQGYGVTDATKAPKPVKEKKSPVAEPLPGKGEKPTKPKKEPKVSISSVAEKLILEGLSNEAVWHVLKEQFKLDDSKKSYPSWYRCRLKRQGKLEKKEN